MKHLKLYEDHQLHERLVTIDEVEDILLPYLDDDMYMTQGNELVKLFVFKTPTALSDAIRRLNVIKYENCFIIYDKLSPNTMCYISNDVISFFKKIWNYLKCVVIDNSMIFYNNETEWVMQYDKRSYEGTITGALLINPRVYWTDWNRKFRFGDIQINALTKCLVGRELNANISIVMSTISDSTEKRILNAIKDSKLNENLSQQELNGLLNSEEIVSENKKPTKNPYLNANTVKIIIAKKRIHSETPKSYVCLTSSYGGSFFNIPKSQIKSIKDTTIKINDKARQPAYEMVISKFIYDKIASDLNKLTSLDFKLKG